MRGGVDPNKNHTHSWSETWTKTETEHYKTCSGCTETKDKEDHSGNPCTVCEYFAHEHQYGDEWEKDSTHHWKECTVENCDQISQKQEHSFSNKKCTTCGKDYVEEVDRIRDLRVTYVYYHMPNGDKGNASYIHLPDGKNMLINTEVDYMETSYYTTIWDADRVDGEWVYNYINYIFAPNIYLRNVEYFVSEHTEKIFVPDLSACKDEVADDSNVKIFNENIKYIKDNFPNVEFVYWNNDIENLTNYFSYQGTEYSYSIDLMPVINAETAYEMEQEYINGTLSYKTHKSYFDPTAFVTIEYQGKTIMDVPHAHQVDIDTYCTKYANVKNVDFLLATVRYGGEISRSAARGTEFLQKIGYVKGEQLVLYNPIISSELTYLQADWRYWETGMTSMLLLNGSIAECRYVVNSQGEMSCTFWDTGGFNQVL